MHTSSDTSSVVWILIGNGKLVNQTARSVAVVVKTKFSSGVVQYFTSERSELVTFFHGQHEKRRSSVRSIISWERRNSLCSHSNGDLFTCKVHYSFSSK